MFETYIYDRFSPVSEQIIKLSGKIPDCVIVAGSGFNSAIPRDGIVGTLPYSQIKGFPVSSVKGHNSELLFGEIFGKNVLVFSGRFHIYEGWSMEEICSPVIIGALAGARSFLLTNAAGGLTTNTAAGNLMLINDVIDLTGRTINKIVNKEHLALNRLHRDLFDNNWIKRIKSSLAGNAVDFTEGVYAGVTGPNFETRAEIRMLRKINAHAVGMSTIHEAKLLSLLGINSVAVSLITNNAKEIAIDSVSHEEVLSTAQNALGKIRSMILSVVSASE